MPLYECVLIARNDVTQQQVEGIADGIAAQLEAEGGAVKKREYWGLRGLAYRIKKNRKGHYMLLGLDAKPAFVTEMERQLGLNEDILRFMTIRVTEIEEAPVGHPVAQVRRPRAQLPRPEARRPVRERPPPRLRRARGIPRPRRIPRRIPRRRRGVGHVRHQPKSIRPPAAPPSAPAGRSTAAASPARSPARTRRRSTTRTCACCRASCPSAARSCPAASPRSRPRSSASWRWRSSAPASWRCCPTS